MGPDMNDQIRETISEEELTARAHALGLTVEEFERRIASVVMMYGDPATWPKEEPKVIRVKPIKGSKRWKPAKARPR